MTATLLYVPFPMMPALGGQRFDLPAGISAEQALKEAGIKVPYGTVLLRNDGPLNPVEYADIFVPRKDWDKVLLIETAEMIFLTLPQDGGASSAIALVLAKMAAWAGPALVSTLGLQGATLLGVSLAKIATAVLFIGGQMLVSSLLPSPKPFSLPNNVSPTYSLAAQSNRARLGAPVPDPVGRNMIMCDLISEPYFDFVDSKQRIMQLFGCGVGEFDIHQIRADQAVLWQDGGPTGTYPEIEIEICGPGETHTLFDDDVVTSTEVNAIELLGTNEEGYRRFGPYITCKKGKQMMKLAFDVVCPAGLYSLTGDGHLDTAEVSFEFVRQILDNDDNPIGGEVVLLQETLKLSTRSPVRRTYEVPLTTTGRSRVWGRRTNERATNNNTSDVVQWFAMRAFLPSKCVYNDITTIAIRATGTANLNGDALQKINVISTRKLSQYDLETQTWSEKTPTRSIAAAVCYYYKDIGGKTDAQIDLVKLWSLNQTWVERGDYFDFDFDQRQSLWQDAIEPTLAAGRTKGFIVGDILTFERDEPKTIYDGGIFTPRNMLPGSFGCDFKFADTEQVVDAIVAKYIDNRTWAENRVLCKLPGSTATINTAPEVEFKGITDRDHVWRDGVYTIADNSYRRVTPSFGTTRVGTILLPGALCRVSHWLSNWGMSAGAEELQRGAAVEVEGVTLYRDVIILSQPWSRQAGEVGENLIEMNAPDGERYGPVTFDLLDDGSNAGRAVIMLTDWAPLTRAYAGKQPRDWGLWSGRGLQKKRPRCSLGVGNQVAQDVKIVSPRPDPGGRTATLNCVVDDPRVYIADQGAPPPEVEEPEASALVITALSVTERVVVLTRYAGDFVITGAADAISFDAQYQERLWQEHGFSPWKPVATGLQRNFTLDNFYYQSAVKVRLRAKNSIGKYGPWFQIQFFMDGIADVAPSNITGVHASRAWDKFATDQITYNCGEINTASSYMIRIVARVHGSDDWDIVREQEISANTFDYYPAMQLDDGGPFNNCYAKMKAKNGAGESPDWVGGENNYP